jgi:hypothetical protein
VAANEWVNKMKCRPGKPVRLVHFVAALTIAGLALPVHAQDIIYFANGDRLSGKIKTLARGKLVFDAPAMDGDANIDWKRIDRIESARVFQFETKDGERFSGRIAKDTGPDAGVDEVRVIMPQGDRRLHQNDIVSANQTTGAGVRFFEANVGAGVSLAKGNNLKQFNLDGSLLWQTTNYRVNTSVSSLFSTQTSAANTNRQDLNFGFARSISKNWYAAAISGFQKSDEQQLDLRVLVGGGPARMIVHNNHMMVYAIGGVILNHERYQQDSGRQQPVVEQVEGLAGLNFSYFRFRNLALDTTFQLFPSFTTAGRVRGDFNTNLRVRLVRGKGLWWNLSVGLLFDSQPPSNGKATDYATTTSLSYSFP